MALGGAFALFGRYLLIGTGAAHEETPMTLAKAPLELGGEWPGPIPSDALAVISRMREVSLSGIRLVSDQQPRKLRIDNHSSGPPHIWLHSDHPETAWIVVDIGVRDWCKLAYQFGHELGHVLCNSWRWGDNPRPPTQWLEESLVEAFSIRGLLRLAESWEKNPPFPNDAAFGGVIREYNANLLAGYHKATPADLAAWLQAGHPQPPSAPEGAAVAPFVALLEADNGCIQDMGALNRWPERTALPIADYLHKWHDSCAELAAPGVLPRRLQAAFHLN
jgi:hypothetical protein